MPRRKKKIVKKVSLSDLLGKEKKANADFYKDEPEKRKHHLKYRTPRNRMINSKGGEYTRPLSGDPAKDAKYHELAREFVNNGLRGTRAYAAVFGVPIQTANKNARKIFNSTWMRAKIRDMMVGSDGDYDDLPKEYLIERYMQMVDNNILDYIAGDGTWLNVRELKALPEWVQQQIKKLYIRNETLPVAVKDEQGHHVLNGDGDPAYIEVRRQQVTIELYDRQEAMKELAKVMQWVTSNLDINIEITADIMVAADNRVERLRRDDLEGNFKRVASD